MRKTWIFLIIIFISASYVFGVFSVHNNISPYTDLKLIYKKITFVENEVDYTFDVESLIHINSVSDIQKIRTNLINFIWNDEGLPKNLPNNIEKISPDFISTGNIGCMTQISAGTRIPIIHTVELLDWFTGGPKPYKLNSF